MNGLMKNRDKVIEKYSYENMASTKAFKKTLTSDLCSTLIAKKPSDEKKIEAIRNSDFFSDKRRLTLLKFNYRYEESGGLDFPKVFKNVITKYEKAKKKYAVQSDNQMRGTMNVIELWS